MALTRLDLCDHGGCNAAAYVVTGALFWCAHHFQVHSDALTAAGWSVDIDERHRLTAEAAGAKGDEVR